MNLLTYRKLTGISQKKFAQIIGVTPAHLCFIEKGIRRPSPELAARIEKATQGKVSRWELLYPEEHNKNITEVSSEDK